MNVVWDFGGVLFDWHPPRLVRRELPQRAPDESAALHWVQEIFQGYGGDWAQFDRGTVEVPALVQRIAARTGLAAHEVQAVVDGVPNELRPVEPCIALLARLHAAGRPQFYLSNMPAPYAAHLEAAHDFVGWFADGVFSSRVHLVKPEPAIFVVAAQRFGVPPPELLFFDDHRPNVDAARAAGWQAEHFVDATAAAAALQAHGLLGA